MFNSRDGRNSATVAWILHQSSERIAPAGGGERLVKEEGSTIPFPLQEHSHLRFTFHFDDLFIGKVNILNK